MNDTTNNQASDNKFALHKMLKNKAVLGIGIALVILMIALFPTSVAVQYQEQYTMQEPYQAQVSYIEQEPYTIQEVVTTTEPYQEQAQIDGSVISAIQDTTILTFNPNTVATFVVKNNDMDT
jgi:predicted membrane-bound spermidine synthase